MKQLTALTENYKQNIKVALENGRYVSFEFEYSEAQSCWFFNFLYESKNRNGYMLANSPNLIREFINILPFGIACSVVDGTEPFFLNDFVTGRVSVYVLTQNEVTQVEKKLYGKIW